MSWAEDFEDIGGFMAEQDSMAEACEEYENDCSECPYKHKCEYSDYRQEVDE